MLEDLKPYEECKPSLLRFVERDGRRILQQQLVAVHYLDGEYLRERWIDVPLVTEDGDE